MIGPDAPIYGFGVTFYHDLQNSGGDFGIFNFLENYSHLKVKIWPFSWNLPENHDINVAKIPKNQNNQNPVQYFVDSTNILSQNINCVH